MTVNIPFPASEQVIVSIGFSCDAITRIQFLSGQLKPIDNSAVEVNPLVKKIKHEFEQYFLSADFQFSLSCQLSIGTEFQQKVWRALMEIPVGEVVTYGQLALVLNSSPRAVGNACRNNPFPVIIPCHRVVSGSGVGGYAGDTIAIQKSEINYLAIKQWLLVHEKAHF